MRRYLASLWVLASVVVASAQTPNMPVGPGSGGGGGGSGPGSGVTSVCAAGGATSGGACITSTGTISTQDQHFALSSNAIVTTFNGGTVDLNSGTDTTPTIAQAGTTGFPAWWSTRVCNWNVAQTITQGGGNIGGSASAYVLAAGTQLAPSCVKLTSDGAGNYRLEDPPGTSIALPLAAASGGTGVANTGGKTFTFGASFTTTGAGAPTLAFPAGSQTYTFPNASSTIVDLSSAQALTGKTIDGSAIGSITPANGAFTALSATGQITSTATTGTAPLIIASTTNVPNLNASSLNGSAIGTSGATIPLLSTANTWTLGQTFSATILDVQSSNGNLGLIGLRNTSAGTAAQGAINLGNAASNTEVTMTLNGSAFTGTPNQFTINSAGNMFLSGGGVQGARIDTAGDFSLMRSFTVAGLPTCNAGKQGALGYVTDATTPTYNGTLAGGGAVIVPVFCNGTAWTSH